MTKSTAKIVTSQSKRKFNLRREAIMHAAAAVFAEKGFHGASTQDIADRLDMKQGSLYYYFPSKEAALEAVCLHGICESVARLEQLLKSDLSLAEKVHQFIYNQLYGLETHCDHQTVFLQQRRFLPPEPRALIREKGREYRSLVEGLIREAQRHGEVANDLDVGLVARALIGLCDSVAAWYQQDNSLDVDIIASQYARVFVSGIQSPGKAA